MSQLRSFLYEVWQRDGIWGFVLAIAVFAAVVIAGIYFGVNVLSALGDQP